MDKVLKLLDNARTKVIRQLTAVKSEKLTDKDASDRGRTNTMVFESNLFVFNEEEGGETLYDVYGNELTIEVAQEIFLTHLETSLQQINEAIELLTKHEQDEAFSTKSTSLVVQHGFRCDFETAKVLMLDGHTMSHGEGQYDYYLMKDGQIYGQASGSGHLEGLMVEEMDEAIKGEWYWISDYNSVNYAERRK